VYSVDYCCWCHTTTTPPNTSRCAASLCTLSSALSLLCSGFSRTASLRSHHHLCPPLLTFSAWQFLLLFLLFSATLHCTLCTSPPHSAPHFTHTHLSHCLWFCLHTLFSLTSRTHGFHTCFTCTCHHHHHLPPPAHTTGLIFHSVCVCG